jgi:hypothetical protein
MEPDLFFSQAQKYFKLIDLDLMFILTIYSSYMLLILDLKGFFFFFPLICV